MHRINLFIDEISFKQLKELPGGISENVRFAIGKYLKELREQNISASKSGGGVNE